MTTTTLPEVIENCRRLQNVAIESCNRNDVDGMRKAMAELDAAVDALTPSDRRLWVAWNYAQMAGILGGAQ